MAVLHAEVATHRGVTTRPENQQSRYDRNVDTSTERAIGRRLLRGYLRQGRMRAHPGDQTNDGARRLTAGSAGSNHECRSDRPCELLCAIPLLPSSSPLELCVVMVLSESKKGGAMVRRPLIQFCLTLVIAGVCAPNVLAQPGAYPIGGPISPWMNMFQRHPGPLDNYHSFVQPNMQVQGALSQQNTALQQQRGELQSLVQNESTGQHGEAIAPTGTGSVFMEYSHYYPGKGGRAESYHGAATRTRIPLMMNRGSSAASAAPAANRATPTAK